tara:strand:+ start:341 stop:553 length:213 start_codon:yes stop_codon:yes gene_type:complete
LRPEDHLCIIKADSLPIGCTGIRLLDDYWDVYNIIKGVDGTASKNCIALALQQLIIFAQNRINLPIKTKF